MVCHACLTVSIRIFFLHYLDDLPTYKRLIKTLPPERIGSFSITLIEWTFHGEWPVVVLFNTSTYIFNSYSNRAVGLFAKSSLIFFLDYSSMSAREEEEYTYEAIIKAFRKALTGVKGLLTDSLNLQPLTRNHQINMRTFNSSARV